jgi:hypothetical protein
MGSDDLELLHIGWNDGAETTYLNGIFPVNLKVVSRGNGGRLYILCNRCHPAWHLRVKQEIKRIGIYTFGLWLAVIIIPHEAFSAWTLNGTLVGEENKYTGRRLSYWHTLGYGPGRGADML